jgi:hypothetical protein
MSVRCSAKQVKVPLVAGGQTDRASGLAPVVLVGFAAAGWVVVLAGLAGSADFPAADAAVPLPMPIPVVSARAAARATTLPSGRDGGLCTYGSLD